MDGARVIGFTTCVVCAAAYACLKLRAHEDGPGRAAAPPVPVGPEALGPVRAALVDAVAKAPAGDPHARVSDVSAILASHGIGADEPDELRIALVKSWIDAALGVMVKKGLPASLKDSAHDIWTEEFERAVAEVFAQLQVGTWALEGLCPACRASQERSAASSTAAEPADR